MIRQQQLAAVMNSEHVFSLRRLLSTEGHTFCDAGPSQSPAKAPLPDLGRGDARAHELQLEAVSCSSSDHVTQGPGDPAHSHLPAGEGLCTALTWPGTRRLCAARHRHILVQHRRAHRTAGGVAAVPPAKLPQPRDLRSDGASVCCLTRWHLSPRLAVRE